MKLMISQKLKRYRKDRDLIQEEVANHLGVSVQTISKWERGDGYPDITMLPVIANYFGVTVDELIGMDEVASSERRSEINLDWEENNKSGKHQENVNLMNDALKTYPNDPLLLVQLSTSLERLDGTDADKHENLRQSILVQEQILRYTPDSEIRGAVLFNLSDAYYRFGDYDKALKYAYKLPNLYKAKENALVHILKDPVQKHDIAKAALKPLAWSLSLHLRALAETEDDSIYLAKIDQIFDILF